jgi:SNF2 family DNA or RNA helicase
MNLPIHLHDYQREAVLWAFEHRKAILADDIGLGKTVTALAWADLYLDKPTATALVVCPKSLIAQWRDHAEVYSPFRDKYHYSSYESLHKIQALPTVLVCDEATMVKTPTAQRTAHTLNLALHTPYVLFLTATPVRNNEADLFTMFYVLESSLRCSHTGDLYTDLHRSYQDFVRAFFRIHYIDVGRGRMVAKIGAPNPAGKAMLNELLRRHVLQRTKALLMLPAFSSEIVSVAMPRYQKDAYTDALNGLLRLEDGLELDIPTLLARITRLRQASLDPALFGGPASSGKADWLKENLPLYDRPTLVFSNYAEYVKRLASMLPDSVSLTGDMSESMRQASIQAFSEGKAKTFILSAAAGGFGLNLQRANLVVWTDLPWTPDVWRQATGRAYRQGQTEEVHEIVLQHPDSIDGKVVKLLQRKGKIASDVAGMLAVWRQLREGR